MDPIMPNTPCSTKEFLWQPKNENGTPYTIPVRKFGPLLARNGNSSCFLFKVDESAYQDLHIAAYVRTWIQVRPIALWYMPRKMPARREDYIMCELVPTLQRTGAPTFTRHRSAVDRFHNFSWRQKGFGDDAAVKYKGGGTFTEDLNVPVERGDKIRKTKVPHCRL